MSSAANLEDELGGLDLVRLVQHHHPSSPADALMHPLMHTRCLQNDLPEELQEEARQEKKSQGGYR